MALTAAVTFVSSSPVTGVSADAPGPFVPCPLAAAGAGVPAAAFASVAPPSTSPPAAAVIAMATLVFFTDTFHAPVHADGPVRGPLFVPEALIVILNIR